MALPEGLPQLTLGWEILDWCSGNLVIPDGECQGDPWVFQPDQAMFILWYYSVDERGRWIYRRAYRERAKGTGKLLSDDTLVPTPNGFVAHGDLSAGDLVYGSDGQPQKVQFVHPPIEGELWDVEFSDGTAIRAHANHLWAMEEFTGGAKRKPVLVSTAEMAAHGLTFERKLTQGRTKCSTGGVSRFRLIDQAAVSGSPQHLPMDPYLFGYWLGDGDSDTCRFTVGGHDLNHLVGRLGGRPHSVAETGSAFRVNLLCGRSPLRELGVMGDKHVPAAYLLAPEADRRALLAGLIDSDGHVDARGRVEITLTNLKLSTGVVALVRSLGYNTKLLTSDAKLNGRVISKRYRIGFKPFAGELDLMPRKAARLTARHGVPFSTTRVVTSISRTAGTGRCITVENPNGIYLVGETYVPTHNSPMVAAIACAELLGPVQFSHFDHSGNPIGKPHSNPLIQIAAGAESQTDQTMVLIADMLGHGPAAQNYNLDIGISRILVPGQRRRIEKVTANFRSREGARPSFVIMEETHGWLPADRGPDFARVLRRNLGKGGGRSIEVTNAPVPGENSVAEMTHKFWDDICAGRASGKGLLFDSFFVHCEDIFDKIEALDGLSKIYANAPWVDLERIFEEILDPGNREVDSRRFYFNETVAPVARWIDDKAWNAAERKVVLRKTDLISIGFRIKKHCSVVAATRLSDSAVFLMKFWERPVDAGRDWEVPYAEIDGAVRRIFEKYNVYNMIASPENFQDIIGRWSVDYEGDIVIEELWTSRNRQKMADAVEMFETAVTDQRLIHDGNQDLTRHVMNCFTDKVAQGVLIRQETPSSTRYIVAAEAAVLSMKAAQEALLDGALKEPPSDTLYSF